MRINTKPRASWEATPFSLPMDDALSKRKARHGQWTQIARRVADFQIGHCLQFQIYKHKRMQSWIMTGHFICVPGIDALSGRVSHAAQNGSVSADVPTLSQFTFVSNKGKLFQLLTCTHGLGFLGLCFFDDCKLLNWKWSSFAVNIV